MRCKVISLATIVTASIAVLSPAQAHHHVRHHQFLRPVLDANGKTWRAQADDMFVDGLNALKGSPRTDKISQAVADYANRRSNEVRRRIAIARALQKPWRT
jgi:hypothetical protein